MELGQINNDNIGFARQVTLQNVDGSTVIVVDLYATIISNQTTQNINYSVNILNKDIVDRNLVAVQGEVNKFKDEIANKAKSLGLLFL